MKKKKRDEEEEGSEHGLAHLPLLILLQILHRRCFRTRGTLGTMMQPENPTVKDPAQVAANNRLAQTQQQVNEVVDIMKTNVERIMEREDRLTELDRRADNLTMSAAEFQTTSRKLKKKYWWKNTKMTIILVCVVLVIIVVIIVACVGIPSSSSSGGGGGGGTPVTTLAPSSPTMPV